MLVAPLYLSATLEPFIQPGGWSPSANALKRALSLQDTLRKQMEDFLSTPKFNKLAPGQLVPKIQPAEIIELVGNPKLVPTAGPAFEQFPAEITQELLIFVQNVLNAIRKQLPVGMDIDGSSFKSASLTRTWRTLSDPMTLVEDMLCGVLCREQVTLVADVLPEVYDLIATALLEAVINHEARTKERPPYPKLKQIAVLLQQPLVSNNLRELLTSNFASEDKAPPATGTKTGVQPEDLLTNLQRREFKE